MRAFTTSLLMASILVASTSPALSAPTQKAGAAGAASDTVTSDVRCLLTMAALGQDKTRQQASIIGVYFFSGRLSLRAPGLDLPAAIKAQEIKMTPQELPVEARRCGPMVQSAMQSLQRAFAPPPGAQAASPPVATPAPVPASPPAPK